ncbi:MAG TPA: Zn-ribbon containing protein, partial [Methanocella sp.]|nr:Zn-ribbon containing protein [Methanocella sp.]
GPPIAGRPEKRPPTPAAQEQPAAVPAALKKPEARPARKSPQDRLGERVESIRVVEQGTYDINLPLLLNRKELIMSKGEGSYIVDLNSVLKSRRKKKKKR